MVDQWGDIQWESMKNMFKEVINMDYVVIDIFDLSNVISLLGMFSYVIVFNGDIFNWDVLNIIDMLYMFEEVDSFN